MRIYIDGESQRINDSNEFAEYIREYNITYRLYTFENKDSISEKYDLIFTGNDDLINQLKEREQSIFINTSQEISIDLIEKCKKTFNIFGEKGKVYPPLKIICRLESLG